MSGGVSMDILGWVFRFLWSNFFEFMNYELNFGSVSFTLWQFLLGSIIVFTIAAGIVRRILE